MLNGEKTPVFWAGLIILSLSSLVIFTAVWGIRHYAVFFQGLESNVPLIVGGIVFIMVGLAMIKSGLKK